MRAGAISPLDEKLESILWHAPGVLEDFLLCFFQVGFGESVPKHGHIHLFYTTTNEMYNVFIALVMMTLHSHWNLHI